jgi:adenylate cyclase
VHMGDVIEKADGTVYGDGVNIAARLQGLADPGGVSVSDAVYGAVRGKIAAQFADQGEQRVKNIGYPVRAFKVSAPGQAAPAVPPPPAIAPVLRPPDKPSLAVLPFNNMSGDPEQEYFADGITEDIITDVSKVSGLFVIARNSSFTFKNQHVDIKDVGRKLGVRHVLEGSVRKAGKKVRINVQLIDAGSGGHVWAERFDRDLEDIFVLQDEVTKKVVEALKVNLTGRDLGALHKARGKVNSEAYDYLMRARSLLLQFNSAALLEGRAMIERALEIDPGLTQACAYLAISYGTEYVNGWNDAGPAHLDKALACARKALEADPDDPFSCNAMAIALMWNRRLDEAERMARHAIEVDPNFSQAHGGLGYVLDFSGRHEEAIASFEQALRLDPEFNLWMHALGRAQFSLKRYAEAEATFKRRLIHMPKSDVTRAYLASLYGHTGRPEEARRVWRELMEINPSYTFEHTQRILPYTDRAPLEHFAEGLRKAGLP